MRTERDKVIGGISSEWPVDVNALMNDPIVVGAIAIRTRARNSFRCSVRIWALRNEFRAPGGLRTRASVVELNGRMAHEGAYFNSRFLIFFDKRFVKAAHLFILYAPSTKNSER